MKHSNLIVFVFILLTLMGGCNYSIPIRPPTILYSLIYISSLLLIFLTLKSTEFTDLPNAGKTLFKLYWLYSLIIVVYSLVAAQTYWDYKYTFIIYIPSIIITLSIFLALKLEQNLNLFKFIIKILFPLGLFLSFFIWFAYPYVLSRVLLPIFLFVLAFPFLKLKHQWLIFAVSILCIIIDLEWRLNVFRIIGCWLLVLLYYLSVLKPRSINLLFFLIFPIPLIFIYLGIEGSLDIFQLVSESDADIIVDKQNTRTPLFEDVFWSLKDSGAKFFFGSSSVGGYLTTDFDIPGLLLVSDKGRYATEVAFLNTLIMSGIVGVTFDILIFFIPAYFAINQSNNNFAKILGTYLIFSWLQYFLGTGQLLDLYNFFLYFIIGLCLSPSFRNSTDAEIKFFFKSI